MPSPAKTGELDAASVLVGSSLHSGRVTGPFEIRFHSGRLAEFEAEASGSAANRRTIETDPPREVG